MIVTPDPCEPVSAEQWAELRDRFPNAYRVFVALVLARDIGTCEDLLVGLPVDPDRLDPVALRWARDRLLVRLDLTALDLLTEGT